jgi:hypothetical protein
LTQRKLRPQDVLANAIRQLLERGQGQGYLLYDEIYDALPESILDQPGELEDLYAKLADEGVVVIDRPQMYHSPAIEEELGLEVKEVEPEVAAHEDDVGSDPVRLYLQEMGAVPLLDRAGEVVLAEQLERGQAEVFLALADSEDLLAQLLRLHESGIDDVEAAFDTLPGIAERLDAKRRTRIDKTLAAFERIAAIGAELAAVRARRDAAPPTGARRASLEREADRVMARLSGGRCATASSACSRRSGGGCRAPRRRPGRSSARCVRRAPPSSRSSTRSGGRSAAPCSSSSRSTPASPGESWSTRWAASAPAKPSASRPRSG